MPSSPEELPELCGRCLVVVDARSVIRATIRHRDEMRFEIAEDLSVTGLALWGEKMLYLERAVTIDVNDMRHCFRPVSTYRGDLVCAPHLYQLVSMELRGFRILSGCLYRAGKCRGHVISCLIWRPPFVSFLIGWGHDYLCRARGNRGPAVVHGRHRGRCHSVSHRIPPWMTHIRELRFACYRPAVSAIRGSPATHTICILSSPRRGSTSVIRPTRGTR